MVNKGTMNENTEADSNAKKPGKAKPSSKRKLKWLVIIIILILIILTALPYGIGYGITWFLESNGAQQASIDDVDFNPFTGRVTIHELQITSDGKKTLDAGRLTLDWSWLSLIKKRLHITEAEIENIKTAIVASDTGLETVAGLPVKPSKEKEGSKEQKPEPDSTWGFGIERLSLVNGKLNIKHPKFGAVAVIDKTELKGLRSWDSKQPAHLDFAGRIDDSRVTINADMQPFGDQQTGAIKLTIDKLPLKLFEKLAEQNLDNLEGAVSVTTDTKFERSTNGSAKVDSDIDLMLANSKLGKDKFLFEGGALTWKGNVNASTAEKEAVIYSVNGAILGEALGVQTGDKENNINIGKIELSGLAVKPENHINVEQINIAGVEYGGLDSNQKVGAEDEGDLVYLDNATINKVQVATFDDIVIEEIALDGVKTNLPPGGNKKSSSNAKAPEGKKPTVKSKPEKAPAPDKKAGNQSIKIGAITLGGASEVRFEDNSIKPPFKAVINKISAKVENLDNLAVDRPSPVKLNATLNKYTKIDVDGTATPLAKDLGVDLQAQISALDMKPLSPYVAKSTGYNITTGQLDSKIDVKIAKKKIDSEVKIEMRKLEVEPGEQDLVDKFAKQISMPLDAALSLLRDKYDNIMLDFTLNGDVNDPGFSLADILNKATANAMKKGALAYLTIFMQPYGAVIALAEIAGEELSRVRLDPIVFTPGSAEISGDAVVYLGKLVSLMKERPELSIHIGGVAVDADLAIISGAPEKPQKDDKESKKEEVKLDAAVETSMKQLAQKRAEAVKQALMKNGSIESERLIIALPEIEAGKSAPRAELTI